MPIYDYACTSCGNKFEHIQSVTGVVNPACPACGSSSVNKLVSIPGLIQTGGRQHGGHTCCGREERCEKPPCSTDSRCQRDR